VDWKGQESAGKQPLPLEDLRNHSQEQLAELRLLLSRCAPSRPDPRRRGFFEVRGMSHVFYICRFPSGAKVALVAVWERCHDSHEATATNLEDTGNSEKSAYPVTTL